MRKQYDVAVIGGGPAGYVAAIKAAQLGGRAAVFEKSVLGGTCLNRGCIPTKCYLKTAELMEEIAGCAQRGIVLDAHPSVDLPKAVAQKNSVVKKLTDGVADHGFFRGLPYRAALLALGRAYRKARARRPGFDERTRAHLEELARLEGERCPSMDRAADAFAALLAGAAEEEPDPVRRRVLEQLLYHLGRWIYLVDAADDLKKDVKSGSYNPLVYRFHAEGGTLTAEDRAALAATLDSSVRAMAAAFELADFGPWRAISESVVSEGLSAVGAAVLNGTFRKGRRRKQRKAGA